MILKSYKYYNFNKIWTEFLYKRIILKILSHIKKPAKNHNNSNQNILTKLNKFSHFIITSSPRNAKDKKTYIHAKWIKNNSIIHYSSNWNLKIYKHNSFIYLHLLDDPNLSVARLDLALAHAWIVSSPATISSKVNLSSKVWCPVRQTFNHQDPMV